MDAQAWKTATVVLAVVLTLFMIGLAYSIWCDYQRSIASLRQKSRPYNRIKMNTIPPPPGHHFERADSEDGPWDQHQQPQVDDIAPPPPAHLNGHGRFGNGIRSLQHQPASAQGFDRPRQSPRQQPRGNDRIFYAGNANTREDSQEESYRDREQRYGRQDVAEPSSGKRHGKGKHRAKR